jgi:hypothetical protein
MLPNVAIRVSRKNTPLPTERGIYPPRSPLRSDKCRNIALSLINPVLSELASPAQ